MKLYDYVSRLTKDGTKVILGKSEHSRVTTATFRDEFGNGQEVVCYTSSSPSEEKRQEDLLRNICWTAVNTRDWCTWWNYVAKLCSKQYTREDESDSDIAELYDAILLTISNKLALGAYDERSFSGGAQLFKMLTQRMEAWQKNATVEAKTDGNGTTNVSISFGSF